MVRIIPDTAGASIGFEPYSPRALAWVETVIVALGGDWRTVGEHSCYFLPLDRVSPTLLSDSGLEVLFGPAPPGIAILRQDRFH